jgi:alkylglycerol monooxygenase
VNSRYIALAIPAIFLLIAAEMIWSRIRGKGLHRFGDVVSNIGCGIIDQALGAAIGLTALIGLYETIRERFGVFEFDATSVLHWVVAFTLTDFCYYWWHRLSHRVAFMWAAHVVHHQSEDYNLSINLRQGFAIMLTAAPFFLPLAVLGVPYPALLVTESAMALYQVWIHTPVIGKLGRFESFFNTPSLHRVHHAVNPKYIDKNFAGTFIIWDRMFGTHELEIEPPVYGTVTPLASYNPIWAYVQYWVEVSKASWNAPTLREGLKIWLGPPGPKGDGAPSARRAKYDVVVGKGARAYVAAQLAILLLATVGFLHARDQMTWLSRVGVAAGLIASIATLSCILEGKRLAYAFESVRLLGLVGSLTLLF